MVLPVPGGPAKWNARPRPVECRSARPHWRKMRSCFRTSASAWLSARSVRSGSTTSSNERWGSTASTSSLAGAPKKRSRMESAMPKDTALSADPGRYSFARGSRDPTSRTWSSTTRPPVTRSHASRTASLISSQAEGLPLSV